MDFLQIIMTPFSWLLRVFCELFNSYGIALILFTIIIKIILFPLNLKGKKGMIKMSLVSGQLRELQKRYGNDRERYNREVQKFYAENKVSPTGGCLWSLLPLLILWPLYAIIPNTRRLCVFSKDYFEAGEESIRDFVERFYNDSKCVTPELLEVGPNGIHAVEVLVDMYKGTEEGE